MIGEKTRAIIQALHDGDSYAVIAARFGVSKGWIHTVNGVYVRRNMQPGDYTERVEVRLTCAEAGTLADYAKRHHMTKSDVLRVAMKEYIDKS